jgi:transketolase
MIIVKNVDQELKIKLETKSKKIRRGILDLAYNCKAPAHLGGALSAVEIMATLYFGGVLNYDSKTPFWKNRDRFILSKGHTVLVLYSTLYEAGYFDERVLNSFEENDSPLAAHPIRNLKLGIESSNGSLGQGLSFCIGTAITFKNANLPQKVFVLVGDGETNEGSVWEAISFAPQRKLDNLTLIIDNNGLQNDGFTKDIVDFTSYEKKLKAFGWDAITVDGHSVHELYAAFTKKSKPNKPRAIIAKTVKGKGVSFMENKAEWHHGQLTEKLYNEAIEELK